MRLFPSSLFVLVTSCAGVPSDPAEGEGEGEDLFAACAAAADYVGPSAGVALTMPATRATYCSLANEGRTIAEEIPQKRLLSFASGAFFLPLETGTIDFALPACVVDEDGNALAANGEGTLTTERNELAPDVYWNWRITQTLVDEDGTPYVLNVTLADVAAVGGPDPSTHPLDGSYVFENFRNQSFDSCQGTCEDFSTLAGYTSCTMDNRDLQRHTLQTADGELVLELRIGDSFASTEPAVFTRAHGTFHGEAFDVTDFFALIYNPEHHHFARDFLVLFDAPIAGACGLLATGLDPFSDAGALFTADCAGAPIDEVALESVTFERVP